MYRVGHKAFHSKRYALSAGLLIVSVVGVIGYLLYRDARSNDTRATNTAPNIINVQSEHALTKQIDEPSFSLRLPGDWQEVGRESRPLQVIEWRGGTPGSSPRSLQIYIDTIPAKMAVNRLLPVEADGNRLALGTMSGNCAEFTADEPLTPQYASRAVPTPAKWQQIDFICDLPNYLRNVIGTGSREGINKVSITGPASGTRSYFLLYTDHSGKPDDATFINIVDSFQAK